MDSPVHSHSIRASVLSVPTCPRAQETRPGQVEQHVRATEMPGALGCRRSAWVVGAGGRRGRAAWAVGAGGWRGRLAGMVGEDGWRDYSRS